MPPSVNRLETLQNLRTANVDAAFATGFASLVTGAFIAGFITHLGGNDYWIQLVSAVPALLGLLQIPGAIWGRRVASYKRYVLPGGFTWRLLYVPLVFLPFLPIPNEAKLFAVLGCASLAAAATLLVNSTYNEWLAEMVPANSRGFFFSRRNAIATAVGASAGLVGAVILDAFKRAGQQEMGFTVIFGLGILFAAVSFFFFSRMKDTPRMNVERVPLKVALSGLRRPFEDRNFRRVLVFLAFFISAQAFAGNLFAAFAIKSLDLPYTIIQWAGVMHALGHVLAAKFFGFLADKYGNKPVLLLVGFGLSLTPTMWLFCKPNADLHNALVLLPTHVLVGATWAGVALCQYNIVLATAKQEDRANYLSVTLTIQSICGFVSPLLGAQALAMFHGSMNAEAAYKAVFLVTMGLRFLAIFFLLPVKEEGAFEVRRALRDLSKVTPRGMRAMRHLRQGGDVESREQAIAEMARHGFTLGGDEVVKALHDPSPRIRRQAARSLARLATPDAVESLIHQLQDHPDLVEEETVDALGVLEDQRAVPPLVRMLQSPRSMLRRAAARALGRIGDKEAIGPLTSAACEVGDPDLRRAALQALRVLGATQADQAISDALFDPHPSVRIAAAEAVSELELEAALPYVRQSLSYYHDEAESEVAYALGAIGSAEDIPIILDEAANCVSVTTRRRCLLGLARLLNVEAETYRLLLMDGMARDTALEQLVKPQMKGNKRLRDALALFSGGDEEAAIRHLGPHRRFPELEAFAARPVEELFVVACALFAHKQ